MTEKAVKNLHQRLQEVAKEVGTVAATGKNQYNAEAVSIQDVENAIRDTLAEHGVITRWSVTALDQIEKQLWRVTMEVTLVNADNDADVASDTWTDIGGNPSAAGSFARKAYYKALFHLAQSDEDAIKPAGANGARKANGNGPGPLPSPSPTPVLASGVGDECPECKEKGLVNRFRSAPVFEVKPWGATLCNGLDPAKPKGYANHTPVIANQYDQTAMPG